MSVWGTAGVHSILPGRKSADLPWAHLTDKKGTNQGEKYRRQSDLSQFKLCIFYILPDSESTKHNPNREPKFHQAEMLAGVGSSTKAPIVRIIGKMGIFLRFLINLSLSMSLRVKLTQKTEEVCLYPLVIS